jgi:hypothetical protein
LEKERKYFHGFQKPHQVLRKIPYYCRRVTIKYARIFFITESYSSGCYHN